MSKKNLARTVIEGGRHNYNKWERRASHADLRARDRNYINEVKSDLENWYDYDVEPIQPVYQGFTDKLGPMYRWLAKQCGRPWNEVRSEIAKTFDGRTTAGRHILHDHLLKSVEETPDLHYGRYYLRPEDWTTSYRRGEFYVDANGILREKTVLPNPHKKKTPQFNTNQIANWLSGRVVGKVGKRLFWFVPADKNKKRGGNNRQWDTKWGYMGRGYYSHYGLHYKYLRIEPVYKYVNGALSYENGKPIVLEYKSTWENGTPTFRQDRKLNEKELAYWNTIPEYFQTQVLEWSPTWDGEPRSKRYNYYW